MGLVLFADEGQKECLPLWEISGDTPRAIIHPLYSDRFQGVNDGPRAVDPPDSSNRPALRLTFPPPPLETTISHTAFFFYHIIGTTMQTQTPTTAFISPEPSDLAEQEMTFGETLETVFAEFAREQLLKYKESGKHRNFPEAFDVNGAALSFGKALSRRGDIWQSVEATAAGLLQREPKPGDISLGAGQVTVQEEEIDFLQQEQAETAQ